MSAIATPKKSACSLLDLPLSVLSSITSHYLVFPFDICQLDSAISRASDRHHFHASIDITFEECLWEDEAFQRWLTSRGHIRCTEVLVFNPSPLHILSPWLAKNAPCIRRLSIDFDSSRREVCLGVRDLCRACSPQLVSLSLKDKEPNSLMARSLDFFLPPSLKESSLGREVCLDDELVRMIAVSCPKLEILSLSSRIGPQLLTTDGTDHFADLTELRQFKLVRSGSGGSGSLSDSLLLSLAKGCRKLKTLELQNCSGLTTVGLIAIGRSCPIESLQINTPVSAELLRMNDNQIQLCSQIDDALTFFPHLRKLELCNCPDIKRASWLENAPSALPFLTELTLSECFKLGGLRHIFSFLKLTTLTLDSLRLQDSDLRLSKPLLSLRSLRISWCDDLTNDGIAALLSSCPRIVCLRLKNNTEVDGDILEKALILCPLLHTLSVRGIYRLRFTADLKLTVLKTLKLVHCAFCSPDVLNNLLSTCNIKHSLECLKIKDCTIKQSSYAEILSAIMSHCFNLRSLTFLTEEESILASEAMMLLMSLTHLSSFTASVYQGSHSSNAQADTLKNFRKANPSVKLEIFFEDS